MKNAVLMATPALQSQDDNNLQLATHNTSFKGGLLSLVNTPEHQSETVWIHWKTTWRVGGP